MKLKKGIGKYFNFTPVSGRSKQQPPQEQMQTRLSVLGLTPEEQKVNDKLMELYQAFLDLEIQHPNEQAEFVLAVHMIQGLLTTRIARRHYPEGWPTYRGGLVHKK